MELGLVGLLWFWPYSRRSTDLDAALGISLQLNGIAICLAMCGRGMSKGPDNNAPKNVA